MKHCYIVLEARDLAPGGTNVKVDVDTLGAEKVAEVIGAALSTIAATIIKEEK